MSGDPAVAAAQRAWDDDGWGPGEPRFAEGSLAIAAAREALAPVRDLHRPLTNSTSALHPASLCSCGGGNWRECPTALTYYTSEELNR